MQLQKMIKVGNSTGMTLSRDFVYQTNFHAGTPITVEHNVEEECFTVRKVKKTTRKSAAKTPELAQWLTQFNKRYKKGLTELAKK